MLATMTQNRRRVLGVAAATIATGALGLAGAARLRSNTTLPGERQMPDSPAEATPPGLLGFVRSFVHRLPGDDTSLPVEGHLASFTGATGWLNTDPLTPEGLRGKVVLVDFWTYTCINWLRTLPYVRAWAAKYADQGLVIIGAHTPEFDFEHNVDNIVTQAKAMDVTYPIAVDSDYGVWNAFDNHYWPAVYIADAQGRIRYHHFGESEYAMQEMVIQQLLVEAGAKNVSMDLVSVDPVGLEVAADYQTLRSPETYLGYGQAAGLASPDGKAKGDIPSILVHTRSKAVANMIHAAEHRGANAVVGMRFDHRDISNHWIELCAYGTAVVASAPPARPRKSGQSTDHRTG